MINVIKKNIKVFLCFLLILSVSGCNKHTEPDFGKGNQTQTKKTQTNTKQSAQVKSLKKLKNVEATKYREDARMYDIIYSEYTANRQSVQTKDEYTAVYTQYLQRIYEIAYARLNADMNNVNKFSDDYQTYLAFLNSYISVYNSNIQETVNQIQSDDKKIASNKLIILTVQLNDFWKNLDSGKSNLNNSNSEKSTEKTKKAS